MNAILLFCLPLISFFFTVSFLESLLKSLLSIYKVNNCLVYGCMKKLAKLSLDTRDSEEWSTGF